MKKYTREELSNQMTYPQVRDVYMKLGGPSNNHKKEFLIEEILLVQAGEKILTKSNRGTKRKSEQYQTDEFVSVEMQNDDRFGDVENLVLEQPFEVKGIFIRTAEEYGFLRGENFTPSPETDVYVSKNVIKEYKLRQGDYVLGTAIRKNGQSAPSLKSVETLNGLKPAKEERSRFEMLEADYPREKFDIGVKCIDLFAPIGKGQRALIVAPPKAGKTTLLKEIASSVIKNHNGVKVFMLLVGERPEEVTDVKRTVDATVNYSTFDEDADKHVKVAEYTLESAKRIVEQGGDAVVLIDSITRLARAYNETLSGSGKTLTGGIDGVALQHAKKIFGQARNVIGGGSLTIIATALIETGSKMDDVIYEEFKGTGNSEIVLTSALAERRVYPAIDISRSGTRKEELLLSKSQLETAYKLRENVYDLAGLIKTIKSL